MIPQFPLARPASKALFAWELGYGLGHVGIVAPVAEAVVREGMAAVVVAHVTDEARPFLPSSAKRLPVPVLPPLRAGNPLSYSDMLLKIGFANRMALLQAVAAWVSIFEKERPTVLVADLSPTAVLAARIVGLPTIIVGSSFNVPPPIAPQPPFRTWKAESPRELQAAAARAEAEAMGAINFVLAAYRQRPIGAVCEMYANARPILSTVPALDHFPRNQKAQPVFYSGPIRLGGNGARCAWPAGSGPKVFLHLRRSNPMFAAILEGLKEAGACVLGYVPDGEGSSPDGMVLGPTPYDLDAIVREADLAITQGNISTSVAFLASGVPVLASPDTVEQALTAIRIHQEGVGAVIPSGMPLPALKQLLATALDEKMRETAKGFAKENQIPTSAQAVSVVVQAIKGICSKTAAHIH